MLSPDGREVNSVVSKRIEADLSAAIMELALNGLRPGAIARQLNIPRETVERLSTTREFLDAMEAQDVNASETWRALTSGERVTNIRVEAQKHAEDALNVCVRLMTSAKNESIKLRAAENVLQMTGAMNKNANESVMVDLTPAAAEVLRETHEQVLRNPPRMLKGE